MNALLHRAFTAVFTLALFTAMSAAQGASLSLENVPLYLTSRADPNVLINMSVETPMGGAAYNDNVDIPLGCTGRQTVSGNGNLGTCYFPAQTYVGYFDPYKCYTYSTGNTRFNPAGAANATTHACSSQWSGNFLNWVSMTAIDMFVWTMTGGDRLTTNSPGGNASNGDTTSLTVIKRARKQNDDNWFPRKAITSSIVASNTVTQYSNSTLYFHNTDWGFNVGTNLTDTINGSGGGFLASFLVRVRVCTNAGGITLEDNCVPYGTSPSVYYKPEGLIQRSATTKRFAVLSYTFDGSASRDGGVLRSNMKYVGPTLPDGTVNSKREWDTDGLLRNDPDGIGLLTLGLNSGVINYINKFSDPGYKTYDPISELFYEGIRYFKNLGPTPEYSNGIVRLSSDSRCGGFWFGSSSLDWQDPIQYRCQKNFIVAINDANPWLDKKLPGTFFTSSTLAGASGYNPFNLSDGDYGQPSNPDTAINVRDLTNKVGALEGLNGTTWTNSGNWTSGSASGVNDSVGGGLGTWDNDCTSKTVGALGEVMGTCPYPAKQNSYYIAGLAYYANTEDLRPDLANDRGKQTVSSFVIDTQEYSSNPLDGPKNMLWLAGKYGGFNDDNNDGIPQTAEWDADGNGVPDNYVLATQPESLVNGLTRAFDFIDDRTSSSSSASVNAGSISSETRVYQAIFDSGDWTGQLLSFKVNTDGTLQPAEWDAATKIPLATSRAIITVNKDTNLGAPFRWANIGATRQGQIQLTDTATVAQDKLDYLRGDQTKEGTGTTDFRKRKTRLGDIISSSPVFVGGPSFLYRDTLETKPYSAFRTLHSDDPATTAVKEGRKSMVYVGANDGMMHGYDADTGIEKLAFIPGAVFANLPELAKQKYSHRYFADGTPTIGDVYYGGASGDWHTILVAGLNLGGQSIYALDITNPANFSETNANSIYRWEYTDTDLGYTYSRPAIVRMKNGKWAAIFGNGYNNTAPDGSQSTTGKAFLYIVDIENGTLLRKIDTGVGDTGTPNGLATPAVVDINGDSIVDYAYAGDLRGNLWKFDLTSTTASSWNVAYFSGTTPLPLFTAKDSLFQPQPITSRPEVGRGPKGVGMIILFGTGKFMENADKNVALLKTQSFYGINDKNTGSATTDRITGSLLDPRNGLVQQQILVEQNSTFTNASGVSTTIPIRVTTDNPVPDTAQGWYMDLRSPSGGIIGALFNGEMQVSDSILRNGRIIFTTLIPDSNPCAAGGTSWLMEMDALSGSRLTFSPFDNNRDGEFTESDYVTVTLPNGSVVKVPISGQKSEVGIAQKPGVLMGEKAEFKYLSGTLEGASGGNLQRAVENPGPNATGRQSWRQIR